MCLRFKAMGSPMEQEVTNPTYFVLFSAKTLEVLTLFERRFSRRHWSGWFAVRFSRKNTNGLPRDLTPPPPSSLRLRNQERLFQTPDVSYRPSSFYTFLVSSSLFPFRLPVFIHCNPFKPSAAASVCSLRQRIIQVHKRIS